MRMILHDRDPATQCSWASPPPIDPPAQTPHRSGTGAANVWPGNDLGQFRPFLATGVVLTAHGVVDAVGVVAVTGG